MTRKVILLILLLIAAACTDTSSVSPTAVPTETSGRPEPTATDAPPAYREAVRPITLDNIADIRYLGRVDAPGQISTIFATTLSPDGTTLAALNDGLLLEWSLVSGELLFATSRRDASRIFYAPDKSELYTVDADGTIVVFEAGTGAIQNDFRGQTDFNLTTAFHEEFGWLALGNNKGEVKVWDTAKRESLITITAHEAPITELAFSHDGTILATAAADSLVNLWNWQTGERLAELNHEDSVVSRLTFSPDDQQLATGTERFATVWSVEEQELLFVLQTGDGGTREVLSYSPDGRFLITAGASANMTVWNPNTAESIAVLPGVGGERVTATFSPDGNLLVTSVLGDAVSLWNMTEISAEGVARAALDTPSNNILYLDWTDDGFALLMVDAFGPVYVWGIADNE